MAEIRDVRERRKAWPWMTGMAVMVLILWMVIQIVGRTDEVVRSEAPRLLRSHPAAAAARPVPEPAPDPAAVEEEALRLRSRIMA